MTEAVTLELPDDVTRHAREVAQRTGREMADVLTDWLRRGAASDDSTHLMPDAAYPILTLYGNESVAQELLDALLDEEVTASTDDPLR